MQKIYIPSVAKAVNRTQAFDFKEEIPDLNTLTPPQGQITVQHCGNYLSIKVQAWTIVTLTCDRTLRQFNHRLVVDTTELIWLSDDPHRGSSRVDLQACKLGTGRRFTTS
jgi:Predicted metal-binding, possibly nucleic acid-binding protein